MLTPMLHALALSHWIDEDSRRMSERLALLGDSDLRQACAAKVEAANVALHSVRSLIGEKMTRFLVRLTAALVVASAAPAAAQTIHYALPELGEYQCLVPSTMPGMKYNVLTQKAELWSNLSLAPSALGTLVLESGGRYRLTPRGEQGTYSARSDGTIIFGGPLGEAQFTSAYSAKNGTFEIRIGYRSSPSDAGITNYCSRRSAAAQMTIDGPPNPGLPGRMVFAREGRVYEVLVERGSVAPLADGTMPYAAPNGELAYMNAAGQIAVVTADGRTGALFAAEVANNGLSGAFNWNAPVRREYLALAPDGSAIAYAAWDAVKNYRVVVRARSGREIVSLPGYTAPNFTPDGRLIVVGYPKEGGPSGVYISGADFRGLRRLDPNLDTPDCPAVSPDGRRVAFVQGGKLWVVNVDGSDARSLPATSATLPNVAVNGWPAWSPDGRWIAVTANLDGASYNGMEILIISADGDAAKLQWLADHQLEYIHTSGDRLTWR